ncbi:acyl-CoA thioesterase [bacterium]|nr:acyl-CoA thioesterase [bacterium]
MFTKHHKVQLSDTDVTGQVYYAKPLEWLEWCRVDWFESHSGNFMDYVKNHQLTFFPSKVHTDYKKPMFFGDQLIIEMSIKEIKKVSFIFTYTVKRDNEIVLTSDITMVCFNPEKKRLAPLPKHLLEKAPELAAV